MSKNTHMWQDVQVGATPDGIPYLIEFANVSFFPVLERAATSPFPLPSAPAASPRLRRMRTSITRASSSSQAGPPVPPKDTDDDTDEDIDAALLLGLHLRYTNEPAQRLSEQRLEVLRWRIARAVEAVGMDVPSTSPPSGLHEREASSRKCEGALYSGMYGQVVRALEDVGLTTTPCDEMPATEATSLGAVFVARWKGGKLVLRKVKLWA